ncbi:MAG: hypothetical protein LBM93_00215 [Oscillospiraceae bacterium]|nr:hypothetical protein [Oscillospiraceae bacterium]
MNTPTRIAVTLLNSYRLWSQAENPTINETRTMALTTYISAISLMNSQNVFITNALFLQGVVADFGWKNDGFFKGVITAQKLNQKFDTAAYFLDYNMHKRMYDCNAFLPFEINFETLSTDKLETNINIQSKRKCEFEFSDFIDLNILYSDAIYKTYKNYYSDSINFPNVLRTFFREIKPVIYFNALYDPRRK